MKNFLLLLLLLTTLSSCEKDPFDYRTKFTGEYHFEFKSSYFSGGMSSDTTYNIDGSITYGSNDHKIIIFLNGVKEDEVIVYEDGTIGDDFYGGEFESTNRLVYHYYSGGLGGHFSKSIIGERK